MARRSGRLSAPHAQPVPSLNFILKIFSLACFQTQLVFNEKVTPVLCLHLAMLSLRRGLGITLTRRRKNTALHSGFDGLASINIYISIPPTLLDKEHFCILQDTRPLSKNKTSLEICFLELEVMCKPGALLKNGNNPSLWEGFRINASICFLTKYFEDSNLR